MSAPKLTQHHRQFMEYLGGGNWVAATTLPDRPKIIAALIKNGWIESKGEGANMALRITPAGLAAKSQPLQIQH